MMKFAISTSLVVALGLLSGCALTHTEQQKSDSPLPVVLLDGSVKTCTPYLTEGAQCLAPVLAGAWFSNTGVSVKPCEVYQVTVPASQFWFDATRRNQPPKGDKGSALMNLAASWKRHPDALWFALMAATLPTELRGKQSEALDLPAQDLSAHPLVRIDKPGELVLYPNDARLPLLKPKYFYGNNQGQIWVLIQRIK